MNENRSFTDFKLSTRNAKIKVKKNKDGKRTVKIKYEFSLAETIDNKENKQILKKSKKDEKMVCLTTWQERKWRQ